MQIRIPFLYGITTVENGQEVAGFDGDWAVVDIPDASDAPKLCLVEGYSSDGIPYLIEVRKMDRNYYRPRLWVLTREYSPIDDGSDRLTVRNIGLLFPTTFFGNGPNAARPAVDRLDQVVQFLEAEGGPRADVVASTREAAVARIAETIQSHRLVLVDGEIWERCHEPRLAMNLSFSPPEAKVVFLDFHEREFEGFACLYRLDQAEVYQAAIEAAASDRNLLATSRPVLGGQCRPWTPASVNAPSVLYVAAELLANPRKAILAAAKTALRDILGAQHLEVFSKAFIGEWVDFRDALSAAAESSNADIEVLFWKWESSLLALEREPERENCRYATPAARLRCRSELEASRTSWDQWVNGVAHRPSISRASRDHR
jgi:hypothetical protein